MLHFTPAEYWQGMHAKAEVGIAVCLLAGMLCQAQAPQVVKEGCTLGFVSVKHYDIVLGSGDGCVEMLVFLTQQHVWILIPCKPQKPFVLWLNVHLHLHADKMLT